MTTPTPSEPARRDFVDRQALAGALADAVVEALAAGIERDGIASLLVSGGSTPTLFFDMLARRPLDWRRVTISLVDERWVPADSERSNARLVATHLLTGNAAAARFVPLHRVDGSPADAVGDLAREVAVLKRPFDAVVLGMGNDGHTASFFPGGDTLDAALDLGTDRVLVALQAPAAGEPRVSFTLAQLLNTALLALHIEGQGKADTLSRALGDGAVAEMPVRAVLRQRITPLTIYWCP
jgi:6-phosphogluconolactonase